MTTLEQFLVREEGDDSKHLPDGRLQSTWDSIGKCWNIGCGITVGVTRGTIWTQAQLEQAVQREFATASAAIVKYVHTRLTNNQTVALESFVYNVGVGGFATSSVLKYVNAQRFDLIPAALLRWVNAKGKRIAGLVKRRKDEIALFNAPDDVVHNIITNIKVPKGEEMTTSTTGVNVSTSNLVTNLLGSLFSALVGVGVPAITTLAGGNVYLAGAVGVLGLAQAGVHIWALVSNNSAASQLTETIIDDLKSKLELATPKA